MEEEFDYATIAKQALVPGFYADSQVARSVKEKEAVSKVDIKRKLFSSIMDLAARADSRTLTNDDIRQSIRQLADEVHISVGQAQKVINVYFKYYCILKWGNDVAKLRELDCPIDREIAKGVWERLSAETRKAYTSKGFFLYSMELKNMDFYSYEWMQAELKEIGCGVRVRADFEIYDKKVIEKFLASGDGMQN